MFIFPVWRIAFVAGTQNCYKSLASLNLQKFAKRGKTLAVFSVWGILEAARPQKVFFWRFKTPAYRRKFFPTI
ncbi:MAG: hypothetical protein DMG11_23025 [Acidobacteria bacterium]|nr:MAG: hypothetical protein DMG11_23025 [Acidobacteriota bacterium]